jgi:hypothetical protein
LGRRWDRPVASRAQRDEDADVRDDNVVRRRRERLYSRWDERGGPPRRSRWWIASPWRWLLAGLIVLAAATGFSALFGGVVPLSLVILLPLAAVSGLAVAAGLHDEWGARRRPEDAPPQVPSIARRMLPVAQVVLVASLAGLLLLPGQPASAPDEDAIAETLRGGETPLRQLPAADAAAGPGEISTLEPDGEAWIVATIGENGDCYVFRFEDGEVVQRGQARDPAGGCSAEVAAAQLDDSSP